MLAKVNSCAVIGLQGALVEVEVDISPGLPSFTIVGLPDMAVQESKERVRAAIRNSGCLFPGTRITVNLAPADLKKEGPSYDLPIAIGILLASEQVILDSNPTIFLGELSLDGNLRHTNGILPMVSLAKEKGTETIFVPSADAKEASLVHGVRIVPAGSLADLVLHLRGDVVIAPAEPPQVEITGDAEGYVDFSLIKGQEHVKRAMEVATNPSPCKLPLATE